MKGSILFQITSAFLSLSVLAGCGPSAKELRAVRYTPLSKGDWKVSTPAEQGLDPMHVAELFYDATKSETLFGLLVVKNGYLIAEGYFNDGAVDRKNFLQSVTKAYTAALVGIALDQGCLSSTDQKMMDFFPEFAGKITDPRKKQITIRDMLKMRSGYPWEERTAPYLDNLFFTDNWRHWLRHIIDFPLISDPGTKYSYSNLTYHLLGIIVARACGTDLRSYGQKHLFTRIGADVGEWRTDTDNHNWGWGEISFTARDMAKFGLLFLKAGKYEGKQVLSASWVKESLQAYSENINYTGWFSSRLGSYFCDIGYGYHWSSAKVGDHHFSFAWGHGGNLIVLLKELDMIIVTAANPLYKLPAGAGWKYEGAIIDLVGKFINSLP